MKTPSFESRDDQKREERVAGFLEGLWGPEKVQGTAYKRSKLG